MTSNARRGARILLPLLALLVGGLGTPAWADPPAPPYTVTVTVQRDDGTPIAGVTVQLYYGGAFTPGTYPPAGAYAAGDTGTTNAGGLASITVNQAGNYKLRVNATDYGPEVWWGNDYPQTLVAAHPFGIGAELTPNPDLGVIRPGPWGAVVVTPSGSCVALACDQYGNVIGNLSTVLTQPCGWDLESRTPGVAVGAPDRLAPGSYRVDVRCPVRSTNDEDVYESRSTDFTIGAAGDRSAGVGPAVFTVDYALQVSWPIPPHAGQTVPGSSSNVTVRPGVLQGRTTGVILSVEGGGPLETDGAGRIADSMAGKTLIRSLCVAKGGPCQEARLGPIKGYPSAPGYDPQQFNAATAPNTLKLRWAASPVGPHQLPVTGYVVRHRLVGSADPMVVSTVTDATSTGATVTGLTPGQRYYFTVSAVSEVGVGSPYDFGVASPVVVGLPGQVSNFVLTPSPVDAQSVQIDFTDAPTGGAPYNAQYHLERSSDGGSTWTPTQSTGVNRFIVGDLALGTSWLFRVRAQNSAGLGPWAQTTTPFVTGAEPTPPGAPTGVQASRSGEQVTVSWTAPADPGKHSDGSTAAILAYEVEHSADDGATWQATPGGQVTAPTTSLAVVPDDEMRAGTAYRFRVRTINDNPGGWQVGAASAPTAPVPWPTPQPGPKPDPAPLPGPIAPGPVIKLKGPTKVGRTVGLSTPATSSTPGATVSYQWYAGPLALRGRTAPTLRLRAKAKVTMATGSTKSVSLAGQRLRLVITYQSPGLATVTSTVSFKKVLR